MRRTPALMLTTGTFLAAVLGLIGPASAQTAPGGTATAPATTPGGTATAPATDAPAGEDDLLAEPDARTTHVIQMECKVVHREQATGVGCMWRKAEAPATAYRLVRLELGGRKVIFRTGDLDKNTFVDARVRKGLPYAYIVQALNENGRMVARSRAHLVLVRGEGDDTTSTTAPGGTATGNAETTRRPARPATTSTTAPGGTATGNGETTRRPIRPVVSRPVRTRPQRPTPSTTTPSTTPSTTSSTTPSTTAPPTTVAARG